jgi:hypothetical protein
MSVVVSEPDRDVNEDGGDYTVILIRLVTVGDDGTAHAQYVKSFEWAHLDGLMDSMDINQVAIENLDEVVFHNGTVKKITIKDVAEKGSEKVKVAV